MSIERLQSTIQRQNEYIDKKYKNITTARRIVNTASKAAILGMGYAGVKSVSKEKSHIRNIFAGASDFVLKHLSKGVKAINKKGRLDGAANVLEQAKNSSAKTKALVVLGIITGKLLLDSIKSNNRLIGIFSQAKHDETQYMYEKAMRQEFEAEKEESRLQKEFVKNMVKAPVPFDSLPVGTEDVFIIKD